MTLKTAGINARLPGNLELALYRVAQEALTNIARHAHAEHAHLFLERNGNTVTLTVEDDGAGFEAQTALAHPRGLGLSGMRERMALVGGTLAIDSRPGQGTRLRASAPVA